MENQNMLTKEEVIAVVRDIIESHTYMTKNGEEYEMEMHVDYQDKLSDDTISKITSADNMREVFNEYLWDMEVQSGDYEFVELTRIIENNWDEDEHGDYEDVEDIVRDFMIDNVHFYLPEDHFLKQEVLVNIMVDTGDGNYDYTLNNLANYYAEPDEDGNVQIDEESSLLWLVRQQGYDKAKLEEAILSHYANGEVFNKLLDSVVMESANTATCMNALTFFVKMTLGEYIDMVDNKKGVILSERTSCGLYDPWNGAGGSLEIQLENPVAIPFEIMEPHVDGNRGYGVDDIYGMDSSHWTETIESYI